MPADGVVTLRVTLLGVVPPALTAEIVTDDVAPAGSGMKYVVWVQPTSTLPLGPVKTYFRVSVVPPHSEPSTAGHESCTPLEVAEPTCSKF